MLENEKGFALPLMIAITFVVAYLLMMLATGLEIKVASYERTRSYLAMNILESERLAKLDHSLKDSDFPIIGTLRKNVKKTAKATKLEEFFAFRHQIVYNDNIHLQRVIFYLE